MNDIFEEWFKRIELRLKYEISPELYEQIMSIMLAELRMLYEEEKLKKEREIDGIRKKYMKED
ncbi:MAG: hypothetical protein AMS17_01715 [Spirochaetes bacterium DG_61]|jgi:hypothetical protein|nr:MAG: hypothetical protein AMS17_01715 [Spirochaetes bacterium DG_61]